MDLESRVRVAKRSIRENSLDGIEHRTVRFQFETRESPDLAASYRIEGYGAVFGSLSEDLGGFREIIAPGAFTEVLAKRSPDVRALFNHDPNRVLARTGNGTLALREDAHGLHYVADVAATSYAADLRLLLDRGDVDQSSFAFRVARGGDKWEDDEETGGLLRTITNMSALLDVSPVTYPAYPAASSGLASSRAPDERVPTAAAKHGTKTEGDRQAKGDVSPFPLRAAVSRSLERHTKLMTL